MFRILIFALATYTASAGIKLAQDVNYPPYAFGASDGSLVGLGADVANGMARMCPELGIEVVEARWADCWTPQGLGEGLENGDIDACMTYTHTKGIRNVFADFSWGVLEVNKAAGLLTLLDDRGNPKVTGMDDLSGKTVVDVAGWAPTADGLDFVENKCLGQKYSPNYNLLMTSGPGNANDLALNLLLSGAADAMFVYADQAYNYKVACERDPSTAGCNCDKWKLFGTKFAYVQTGQFGYVNNGTTLALAKKGSGVVEKLNPCLKKFMATKDYYDICMRYNFKTCYPNDFFPGGKQVAQKDYNKPTDEHEGDCATGYCKCTGTPTTRLYSVEDWRMSTPHAILGSLPMGMGWIVASFVLLSVAFGGYALGVRHRQPAATTGGDHVELLRPDAENQE